MKIIRSAGLLTLSILASPALAEPLAYVANQQSGTVSIIDTETDKVIGEMPAGKAPRGVAVSPDGSKLFVSDGAGRSLVILDLKERKIMDAIPLDSAPSAVDMHGSFWVATGMESANAVAFVDPVAHNEVFRVPTKGDGPEHAAFAPDGSQLYVSLEDDKAIDIIDVDRRESVGMVKVGRKPRGIGFLPDGSLAYVASEGSETVAVIDTRKREVIATIPVGERPNGIAISPDGRRIYVSNAGSHSVSVIDSETNKVVSTIQVGERPLNMAMTADGSKLYVACGRANSLAVIDTRLKRKIRDIPVGKAPWSVAIPQQENALHGNMPLPAQLQPDDSDKPRQEASTQH